MMYWFELVEVENLYKTYSLQACVKILKAV